MYDEYDTSSYSDDMGANTLNDVCGQFDSSGSCCPRKYRKTPCGIDFSAVITPLNNVVPQYSNNIECVEFVMRRKNRNVTIQWEPFSGVIKQNGVSYLSVEQGFCNLPEYPIYGFLYIKYNGVGRITFAVVDPCPPPKTTILKFYLNADGSSTDVNVDDTVEVLGGQLSWTVCN